ncbi:ABC transporter permease subunit [Sinorhizobium medicae]|uniref:ABC transporter permease n=1 Tax=Sinorhizobium medicae TaxID=110321 RepID=UPI0012957E12|nr:ABC transporter permease [Sinorhizobium medicae]MDX1017180.1 ABC transporter permease subunit [Sinorhizobium medicae]MDX2388245.1 ABC transporter permease subunit [Sinorhizobium medicae]MQU73563.1 ABC transporter permease subunit [Sinorhizobium medicae]
MSKTMVLSQSRPFRPLALGKIAAGLLVALILFFLILPTLIVIPISFGSAPYIEFPPSGLTLHWYLEYFSDPDWIDATLFSLRIALFTTIAATIIGTLAAVALVRGDLPGKSLILGLALSPLIVPHIIIAIAVYLFFAPLGLTGNFFGFLLAHTMLTVPYVVVAISASLQRLDPILEMAALNCGAGRARTFFEIVLPQITPGVMTGAVFAFISSFDEATVAFFISGIGGKTITKKLFEDIDLNLTPVIAAVSTIIVVISILLMGAIRLVQNRTST